MSGGFVIFVGYYLLMCWKNAKALDFTCFTLLRRKDFISDKWYTKSLRGTKQSILF